MTIPVKIMRLRSELGSKIPLPSQMSHEAAGFDVSAAIDETLILHPLQRLLVPCGFAMALPKGFEAQVRPRSGLAYKHGITVLNAPGTIDSDYRGEVKVLLINLGDKAYAIEPGSRIAQLVFAPVSPVAFDPVLLLDETPRGSNGYGSTGV